MLDPQRAVLIEGGDALLGRHKRRAGLVGGSADKVYDGYLRHPRRSTKAVGPGLSPGWLIIARHSYRIRVFRRLSFDPVGLRL